MFVIPARNRLRALDASLEGSTWVGTTPGGDKLYRFQFAKSRGFSGFYRGFGAAEMEGTWSQSGDAIRVELGGRYKGLQLEATRNGDEMKGSWSMGSYSFVMKRVLRKPLASDADEEGRACNFKGFTVVIFYRDKDKVNLSEMAAQVAAKLEPTGADVKVKKGNFKSESGHLTFYNGQNEIASKLADCISDIARVTPVDGKESSEANVLFLYLQELPGDAEQASVKK